MTKGEKAKELFYNGYNCSQAVAVAFCDEMNLDENLVKQLTIGFGGGVGRMREVCGTVSAMAFVISALYPEDKSKVYARVQEVAEKFKKENGSIVCRELLNLNHDEPVTSTPDARTAEYYKKRPCPEIVENMANILEEYIKCNK